MNDNNEKITKVEDQDPGKKNSPIVEVSEEEFDQVSDERATCWWNGQAYSTGANVCMSGYLYRCSPNGTWGGAGRPC
jgi:hypothetical protein